MLMLDLTRRQRDVLLTIRDYCAVNGIGPTLDEVGERLGINKVAVFGSCRALVKKGYLKDARSRSRAYVPTIMKSVVLMETDVAEIVREIVKLSGKSVEIDPEATYRLTLERLA